MAKPIFKVTKITYRGGAAYLPDTGGMLSEATWLEMKTMLQRTYQIEETIRTATVDEIDDAIVLQLQDDVRAGRIEPGDLLDRVSKIKPSELLDG